jgi:predicted permease
MTWWARLWRRKQMEQDLEREVQFHLDQLASDLAARGVDPARARRQARLAFGGSEKVKEDCRDVRGTRWLEDLGHDLRYTVRTLRQNPGFAAVALLTLALGSGATTIMFTVVNGVLLKPLSYPEPDRLVTLQSHTEKYGDNQGFSYLDFLDARQASRSTELAAWLYGGGTVTGPGEPEYVDGIRVSAEWFSVLGVPLQQGRAFRPEEDRLGGAPVIAISSRLWERRYGRSAAVLGSAVHFEGKAYTVVAIVAGDSPLFGVADVYTPLAQWDDPRMRNRGAPILNVDGRLRSGVTLAAADKELALISRGLAEQYPRFDAGRRFLAQPMHQTLTGDVRPTLWLLLGAVGLVLLIGCANIASLLLARAVARERELALRVALGAGQGRLVRQCLTESTVLAFGGGALGVLAAVTGLRPFLSFWPGNLPRAEEIRLDWRVLVFAVAVSLVCGILFGIAPALRSRGRELEQALRAGARSVAGGARRWHASFVISEIAVATVLLVSAGMLGRTMLRLSALDPGIDIRNVLTARVEPSPGGPATPTALRAAWQDFVDRAQRVPGVQSVVLSDIIPMRVGQNFLGYSATPDMPPPDRMPVALASCVSPDYLQVMGLPLLQGRFLNERDRLDSAPVVVIDEVMAEHAFGGQAAVGRRLWVPGLGPAPVEVIGVVRHVRHWGLAGDDQSKLRDQVYYPFAQVPDRLMGLFSSVMSVAIRTRIAALGVVESLRRAARGTSGDPIIYDIHTMEQLTAASLARQRFLLLLFGVFASLALLLAAIGIYGVLAYLNSRRVPEIGLRMALGAGTREVLWMVLRQSFGMLLIGAGAGLLASLAAARLLQRLVQGMPPAEPSTFAIMMSVLCIAALAASFFPARRASRVDPMRALRQD